MTVMSCDRKASSHAVLGPTALTALVFLPAFAQSIQNKMKNMSTKEVVVKLGGIYRNLMKTIYVT
jgi:hypothetical protein